ncbi:MAG: hypothetical protein J7J77_03890 [Candidatus Cloacimonetes bacterium]|nr:hypothetical protein [Candidatus Cloacimonadota bacterium]
MNLHKTYPTRSPESLSFPRSQGPPWERVFFSSIFLLVISLSTAFATTAVDLSSRIVIDGVTDDFTSDEELFIKTPLSESQELDDDSWWGEYNDVKQIKVTWDNTYLYVAVDACCWDNNVILFIDIYDDYGIQNMLDLNTWKRAFKFYGTNPDFFLATWDTNSNPKFFKMREGSSITADEVTIRDSATFNTGNLNGGMEGAIPWETLYYDSLHTTQNYPKIKMLAVITTGADNLSGPDVAPDNLGGMPSNGNSMAVLDNYAEITIDGDGDGLPDIDISPKDSLSFFKTPPFKAISLNVNKVIFPNGKVFAPNKGEIIKCKLVTNRITTFNVEIYSVTGEHICNAVLFGEQEWQWDGRDGSNKLVPFGIYILRFVSDSGEISHNEAVVVIK